MGHRPEKVFPAIILRGQPGVEKLLAKVDFPSVGVGRGHALLLHRGFDESDGTGPGKSVAADPADSKDNLHRPIHKMLFFFRERGNLFCSQGHPFLRSGVRLLQPEVQIILREMLIIRFMTEKTTKTFFPVGNSPGDRRFFCLFMICFQITLFFSAHIHHPL